MGNVSIKVLGCGDAFASGGRFNSCYFIESASTKFLLDCGASSLVAMKRYGIETSSIDMIVLSHFHGDHFGGVPFFLLDAAMASKRKRPLTILSPKGGEKRIRKLAELLYPGSDLFTFPVIFLEYEKYKPVRIDNFQLTSYPAVHTKETLPHALRIEIEDKVIAFSGDTAWTDELIKASAGADLFICECNMFDKVTESHLSYKEIVKKLDLITSRKIRLTHMGEAVLAREDKMDIKHLRDGMLIRIPSRSK